MGAGSTQQAGELLGDTQRAGVCLRDTRWWVEFGWGTHTHMVAGELLGTVCGGEGRRGQAAHSQGRPWGASQGHCMFLFMFFVETGVLSSLGCP